MIECWECWNTKLDKISKGGKKRQKHKTTTLSDHFVLFLELGSEHKNFRHVYTTVRFPAHLHMSTSNCKDTVMSGQFKWTNRANISWQSSTVILFSQCPPPHLLSLESPVSLWSGVRGCYLLWVWGTRLPLWPRPPTWGCWAREDDEEDEGGGTGGLWDKVAKPTGRWLSWWGLPLMWEPWMEGSCCRLRMLSMAHCKCSVRESSGGLPLEKLALSISGESDLQRLAGRRVSRVKDDSGEGGPGACWSILNVPPALCLFFIFLYLLPVS